MRLSIEQSRALDLIQRWMKDPMRSTFVLAGYAGTGKTTLLQHFINQQSNLVTCLAPTGKAASVLQKRLDNARVSTIHSALYKPVDQNTSHLDQLEAELVNHPGNQFLIDAIEQEKRRLAAKDVKFSRKQDSEISPHQLVVVDEASMVTKFMKRDLEATMAKILYVGDPGQLPPVQDEGFFRTHQPDAMLSEVQRQALDSPIIRISMDIRAGKAINFQESEGFRKMPKESLPAKDWLLFDQVITGTNDARRRINRYFRRQRGYRSWWPCAEDKLICLRNETDGGTCYINGVQAMALNDALFIADFQEVMGDIVYEGAVIQGVPFYRYPFQIHYDARAVEDPVQSRRGLVQDFDYAYAITVHKSQGSEWDNVLLADDGMKANDKEFRKRWLYTAVTRAKKSLTWVT
jgi:exodeoxyribonuclease-5